MPFIFFVQKKTKDTTSRKSDLSSVESKKAVEQKVLKVWRAKAPVDTDSNSAVSANIPNESAAAAAVDDEVPANGSVVEGEAAEDSDDTALPNFSFSEEVEVTTTVRPIVDEESVIRKERKGTPGVHSDASPRKIVFVDSSSSSDVSEDDDSDTD